MDLLSSLKQQQHLLFKQLCKIGYVTRRSAVDLAHKIYGPSPSANRTPIFALHGILGSKRNWDSLCKMLTASTNYSVVAVDARNHGDSPHSSSHTYLDLASDVSKLITSFSVDKAIIIGHSMGGRTGMALALTEVCGDISSQMDRRCHIVIELCDPSQIRQALENSLILCYGSGYDLTTTEIMPSKVGKLIVVDISPITTARVLNDFFKKLMIEMNSVNFTGIDSLTQAKDAVKAQLLVSGIVENMDGMQFILMNITKKPDNSFGWKYNLNALINNFNEIASFPNLSQKHYAGPTLFIGGKESDFIPPDDFTDIQKLFPKAQLQYVSGVGHNVHAEDPQTFLNLVLNFLSSK